VAVSQREGSPLALAPNGLVLVNANSGLRTYRHQFIIGLEAATGQQRWIVRSLPWAAGLGDSVPNSKGVAPLVTAANLLYVPFVGPAPYRGIEVFGPTGRPLQRLLPDTAPGAMAAAPDGTLYALSGGKLTALAPAGGMRWQRPSFANAVLVGLHGTIYTADGTNGVGAYSLTGRLLWRCTTGDEVVSLAERADGTVMALGQTGLSAVSTAGHRRWRRPLGHAVRMPSAQLPSIAVDAAGRAYVGSSDGTVRAIAPNGSLLWTLHAGGPTSQGDTPSIALGPGGTLVITGTDGRLRVYQ
jgi:outer membrane protein assembly factor BamB